MLTKHSEFARLAAHGGVPHMRCVYWNDKVHPIVLLENREFLRVFWVGSRYIRGDWIRAFRLERWIEQELEPRRREELCDALKIGQTYRRLNLPQGYEALHVGLEDR